MKRRDFLSTVAAASLLPRLHGSSTATFPVHFRKPQPFEPYVPLIDPTADTFACEADAMRLKQLLQSRDPKSAYYVLANNVVRRETKSTTGAGLEYRVAYAKADWSPGEIHSLTTQTETFARAARPLFRDITAEVFGSTPSFRDHLQHGIPYWRGRLDSATGIDVYGSNGVAAGDIDNDGVDEIYVCQPGGLPNRLYKRRMDGTMEDITERANVGLLDDTASALFVDFRNSGLQDLVVLRGSGPLLFLNKGEGRFELQPDAFRFRTGAQGTFTGMAAADYDRDGKVDLYLCSYVYFQSEDQYRYPVPYHDAHNGPPNFLFRNRLNSDGSGSFEDVTAESGISSNNDRYSFAAAWCDYDGDGWPDLYVANDFGRNNLYKNYKGKFRDVAREAGVEDIGPGMSAAWFDYDGDGRPDLYVANMWSGAGQRITASPEFASMRKGLEAAWHGHSKGNSLYRNRGDGSFEYTGAAQRVEMGRWAWAADGHDFDNDGTPEIFITSGMITNSSDKDLMSFFWRQVVAKSSADGTVVAKYEDGWNAINQFIREEYSWNGDEPNVFYKRDGGKYVDYSGVSGLDYVGDCRAFAVTDLDGDGNLDLIVKGRLGPQVRVFQNDCAHNRKCIALKLTGSSSNRDAIGARVDVDGQVKFVTAGSGFLSQHTKILHFGLKDVAEAKTVRITWPSGTVEQVGPLQAGFRYEITEGSKDLRKIAFREQRTPKPPATRLEARNTPVFETTWLMEPVPLPERRPGPGLFVFDEDSARKQPDLAAHYALFRRYLFDWRTGLVLPLILLLDDQRRAVKIYSQMPSAAEVRADQAKIGEASSLALPFPGHYVARPSRNYYRLGGAFYLAGYPDQSVMYFEEVLRRNDANDQALTALGQIHLATGRTHEARRYLERALAANPRSFQAWSNLGGVEFTEGNAAAALEDYRRALAIRPHSALAMTNCGQAYSKLGNVAAAQDMFEKAAAADPADPDPVTQLGLLAVEQGRNNEARDYFKRAITIRRDYSDAINNLGVLYLKMGQPDDAIAAFQYGLQVAPGDDTLYLNLGRLYLSRGERDRARDVVRMWVDRNPDSAAARKALRDLEGP